MDPSAFAAAPPLAVSLTGPTFESDARRLLHWAAETGFRSVQLNAAAPGLRPRELDRSARRDLASLLRRLELSLAGLDLIIPPEHFLQPDRADRAMSAAIESLELAADLASLLGAGARRATVSMSLPAPIPSTSTASAADAAQSGALETLIGDLSARAERCGAAIADLSWPPRSAIGESGALAVALDPAALLLAGADPAEHAARLGHRLLSARLSDISPAGRVAPGRGRLDADSYIISLVATGYTGHLVLDLRSLADQQRVAAEAVAKWGGSR